ncbi:dihydrofolate reductase family protein [Nocardioides mangrovi]|uniref:Dihydrofolate reductase family protein n=1 Tax=Nocardioides mangrovi TaxID=2874580 RepID=A0ABS7UEZ2_9ACTN|nr:dihydrofolate reductase family protein [Nocardioides mangrovi]MBZ5739585.1 dihydrofolate reductase family protein [Nocardioides mangrovi]
MRTLVTTHFTSLDGVAEAPGGEEGYAHSGWTFAFEAGAAAYERKGREQEEAAAFLMGGRSYDAFSQVWPTMDYFAGWNAMPKYVVSSTVTDPQWANTTVLTSLDDVAALKAGDGGPIFVQGSMLLTQSLLKAGLVDEMRLMVFPVVLGSGRGIYPTDAEHRVTFSLAESTTYDSGVQYQVLRTLGG